MTDTTQYTITLPNLIGTREKAVEMSNHLPNDLTDTTVILDALDNKAMAQCVVDELCKQIAYIRKANIVFVTANATIIKRAKTAMEVRDISEKLKIVQEKP